MPRRVFEDFDEFADNISGVAGRFVPTARSTGDWWIERVRIDGVDLQQLQIGAATTFAGDGTAGTLAIGIPVSDSSSLRIDGQPLTEGSFVMVRSDQPFTASARGLSRWAGVTLPADLLRRRSDGGPAQEMIAAIHGATRARTERGLLERLRHLIIRMSTEQQDVKIVEPAAVNAALEELLHAAGRVLDASTRGNDKHIGRPQVSRTRVIARCLELIDASEGQPLFIDDLCNATQVSERTLRNIFQEFFGVGPMRLLKVRQLREIRSALLRANPQTDTVTKIAARFGVWDFSLFARNYRALYAEAPSETLRRLRERPLPQHRDDEGPPSTWIAYAARRFMTASPLSADVSATLGSGPRDSDASTSAAGASD